MLHQNKDKHDMKLADYAKTIGISYQTAWRHFNSFAGRLYGQRRAQRKTEKIVATLQSKNDE